MNVHLNLKDKNCIGCGLCVNICPAKIFTLSSNTAIMNDNNKIFCIGCQDCVSVCPKGVIESSTLVEEKTAPSNLSQAEDFLSLLCSRRSVRSYKPNKLTAQEKEYLSIAASVAPKGGHTQNIRNTGIIILENDELITEITNYTYDYIRSLKKKLSSVGIKMLKAFNIKLRENINSTTDRIDLILKAKEANLNMLTYNSPNIILLHCEKGSPISRENLTVMEYQLMLCAEALGLGTCFLGWLNFALQSFRVKKSKNLERIYSALNIPSYREIVGAFSIGQKQSNYIRLKSRGDANIVTIAEYNKSV